MKDIKALPARERPREKLAALGPSALSDEELLAVILGSGSKGNGVRLLSRKVLQTIDRLNGNLSKEDFSAINGIGPAKAALLGAALEFARRRIRPEGIKIKEPKDILPLVQHLADRKQEHFTCTSLNGAHEVIATRIVTVGLVNAAQVHPREVFSDPITDRATAIIVAHNHPSGDLQPSVEDRKTTERLKSAGEVLGIKLLDHLIFTAKGYLSFQEEGFL